jgi:hypothetical protein
MEKFQGEKKWRKKLGTLVVVPKKSELRHNLNLGGAECWVPFMQASVW